LTAIFVAFSSWNYGKPALPTSALIYYVLAVLDVRTKKRMLLQIALALALTVPQGSSHTDTTYTSDPGSTPLTPQDITVYAPDVWCSNPLDMDFFGPNEFNGWFCADYLRGLVATGHGFIEHPVVTQSTWTDGTYDILSFYDQEVRLRLLGAEYDGLCSLEHATFIACHQMIGACNQVEGPIFEDVGLCRETCQQFARCTGDSCSSLPVYDSDNTTHCVATVEMVESSAAAIAASVFLALLF
jgi:hypothetical protein